MKSFLLFIWISSVMLFGVTIDDGKKAFIEKDYTKAFEIYSELAKSGDKVAQRRIGIMYHDGLGVKQDYKKAFLYTKMSADQYDTDAIFNLGLFYLRGEGTPINPEQAYTHLRDVSNEIKAARDYINYLDNIEKKANLQNSFCSGDCILTYEVVGIDLTDESIDTWKQKGVNAETIPIFLQYGINDPNEMAKWNQKVENFQDVISYLEEGYKDPEIALNTNYAKIGAYITIFILIIVGIALGAGENRRIVVFKNYDDLGLSFLIPASYVLIVITFPMGFKILDIKTEDPNAIAQIIGIIVGLSIFLKVVVMTFKANESIFKSLLAILVKIPLSFLWVFAIIQIFKPSGNTQNQRRENRSTALILFTFLTPIIGALVVEKQGFFSPKSILKGKHIGQQNRDHL